MARIETRTFREASPWRSLYTGGHRYWVVLLGTQGNRKVAPLLGGD
ncbi:MAG: hypothetical protein JWN15_3831, partial [Firmicutes bacterium]|nr:hypothetical protein [Bacillota bacterium]